MKRMTIDPTPAGSEESEREAPEPAAFNDKHTRGGRSPQLIAASLALALIATLSLGITSAQPASASAYGCNSFQKVLSGTWVPVYASNYCVRLDGSGRYVNYVRGNFSVNGAKLCNYNHTAEFFDTSGRWYKTYSSPVRQTCTWGTYMFAPIYIKANMKAGRMCSTLRSNGARITSVCHSIY